MKKNEPFFQVEYSMVDEKVELHFNKEGISNFINQLEKLREMNLPEHIHLMTNAWGGEGLNSDSGFCDSETINHLKIYCWE